MKEEYIITCTDAIEALCKIAEYTDDGEEELTAEEIQWLAVVQLSFYKAMGAGKEGDDGSGFRVDGTIY